MKTFLKQIGPTEKREHTSAGKARQSGAHARQGLYVLRLYVNGSSSKTAMAVNNIKVVCAKYLDGRYDLEVVDIFKHAQLARDAQIVAVPTLIKRLPAPRRVVIGDMSNQEQVLFGLDLRMRKNKNISPL